MAADGRRSAALVVHVPSLVPVGPKSLSILAGVIVHMSAIIAEARFAASERYRASLVTRIELPRRPIRPRTPNAKMRIAINASSR